MGDVLTFTPRPKPVAPEIRPALMGAALRASLEEAAQIALDAADRIIAMLDRMDGDADHEDGGDAEPSLAAPENATGSQVVYMRGSDRDGEEEGPETVSPEVPAEQQPEAVVLPWRGYGNVIAAAGAMLLDMLERA
jgi:ABC-type Fe3+-hydroxamate transport system substrate-binding protein